jgi:hypothetical protein
MSKVSCSLSFLKESAVSLIVEDEEEADSPNNFPLGKQKRP